MLPARRREIRTFVNTLNYLSLKSLQQQIHRIIISHYIVALIHTRQPPSYKTVITNTYIIGETRRWHEKHRVEMQKAPRNLNDELSSPSSTVVSCETSNFVGIGLIKLLESSRSAWNEKRKLSGKVLREYSYQNVSEKTLLSDEYL